jgi:hypothetical protein
MITMYPAKINSPDLTLTSGITSDATTIAVSGSIDKLPAAPNIFVIGTGEDAETVYYPTDASGGTFSGVTRAFNNDGTYGVAKAWDAGTVVSRLFTAYDYDTLRQNLLARKTTLYAYSALLADTNSADIGQTDMSGGLPISYGVFTVASRGTERLSWEHYVDSAETLGNFTAQIEWTANTTSTNKVVWGLYAIRVPDEGSYDATPLLVHTFTASAHCGVAWKKNLDAASTSFAVTGSGHTIFWLLKRLTTDGATSDDLAVDAYLRSIRLTWTVS